MSEVVLSNPALTVRVDLDLGAEITHLVPAGGTNLLFRGEWSSPISSRQSESYGNQALDWLSAYRGGWQELFPNAGAGGTVLGTPLPFHGEASRNRWSADWHEDGRDVTLTSGTRLPLVLKRRMRLDSVRPVLFLEETIVNEADFAVPYIWGHHPAFGPPLAAAGAKIDLPGGKVTTDGGLDGGLVDIVPGSSHVWPVATSRDGAPLDLSVVPTGPRQRLCYIEDLDAGWYAIRNPETGLGAAMAWDLADFPCLWFWQEIGSGGFPWFGRANLTALEPHVQAPSHGLEAAIAAGTARSLPAGGSSTVRLSFAAFSASDTPVRSFDTDGTVHLDTRS